MKKNIFGLNNNSLQKLYQEASKYCLDVSKLIFGGIVISGIMGLSIETASLIWIGLVAVVLTALLGLILFILGHKN